VTSRAAEEHEDPSTTPKPDNRNKNAKAVEAYCAEYSYEGREPGEKDSRRAEAANIPDGEDYAQA